MQQYCMRNAGSSGILLTYRLPLRVGTILACVPHPMDARGFYLSRYLAHLEWCVVFVDRPRTPLERIPFAPTSARVTDFCPHRGVHGIFRPTEYDIVVAASNFKPPK